MNSHKRIYALKFQSVVAPNSKRHDSGMLADSGLLPELHLILIPLHQKGTHCLFNAAWGILYGAAENSIQSITPVSTATYF